MKRENVTLSRSQKDVYLQYKSWNKKAEYCHAWPQLDCPVTQIFRSSAHGCTWLKALRVLILESQASFSKQANLQKWNLRMTRVGCNKTESLSIHPGGGMESKLKSGGLHQKHWGLRYWFGVRCYISKSIFVAIMRLSEILKGSGSQPF